MANQILRANLLKKREMLEPQDGAVVRKKVSNGKDVTHWKDHKEEVTHYFHENI